MSPHLQWTEKLPVPFSVSRRPSNKSLRRYRSKPELLGTRSTASYLATSLQSLITIQRPTLFPPKQEPVFTPSSNQTFKMGLEAVMIVVDNSESSRNGDYTPTRFEAQSDAVSLIFSAITQANPESSVGLMSMGGKGPEVLVTLTTDHGKILEGLHRTKTKIRGGSHLATGIQIAGVGHSYISVSRCNEADGKAWTNSLPSNTDKTNPNGNVSSSLPARLSAKMRKLL